MLYLLYDSAIDLQKSYDCRHYLPGCSLLPFEPWIKCPLFVTCRPPPCFLELRMIMERFPDELVAHLNQSSAVTTLDFHPATEATLCDGMQNGDVQLWDIIFDKILIHKPLTLWNKEKLSESFKKLMEDKSTIPVKMVLFHEDGSLCVAAFSKNLLHVYCVKDFQGGYTFHDGLEVHVGLVSDVVFPSYKGQRYFVLCGGCNLV